MSIMKQNLLLTLLFAALYSSNGLAKCADGTPDCPPCMDVIAIPSTNNEYPAEKLKEDQAKAALEKAGKETKFVADKDYLNEAKSSAIDMLIIAAAKYKEGTITKDQYIEVANQVSKMAEYANSNSSESKCVNMGLTGNCEKLVVSVPKK